MKKYFWEDELNMAVTLCAADGEIIYMNKTSLDLFEDDGGEKLIGANVLDCHPEPSRTMLERMINEEKEHVYTIEKGDKKKIICQKPGMKRGNIPVLLRFLSNCLQICPIIKRVK